MINIAICDDNILFTEYIESILLDLQPTLPDRIMITIFYSGETFLKAIEKKCLFDIVLMDIEMEEIDGVRAGEILRTDDENDQVFLIYISSHETYLRQLFNVQPYAFLEKPLDEAVFIEKMKTVIEKEQKLRKSGKKKVFTVQQSGHEIVIPSKKIIYLESKIRKIIVHTQEESLEYYSTLNKEEVKLDEKEFVRIHQSYLVNLYYTKKITNTSVVLTNGLEIPVSYSHRNKIKKAYMEYRRSYFEC